jgi:hypothetical protein
MARTPRTTRNSNRGRDLWTDDRWRRGRGGRILTTSGSNARKLNVDPTEAERIANELAGMVAREHRRMKIEQGRREAAESIAADLAVLLAHDRADLEREREQRERAEERLRELLPPDEERAYRVALEEEAWTPRFVPVARAPRHLHRIS